MSNFSSLLKEKQLKKYGFLFWAFETTVLSNDKIKLNDCNNKIPNILRGLGEHSVRKCSRG